MNAKIKVLVVDDSAIVRRILSDAISSQPDMEVVGTAPDPYVARDQILALEPDVLTLDIEMPRMDGLTFLRRLMKYHPIPTIIVSSLGQASCKASLDALHFGAVDVMAKPNGPCSVGDLRHSLASRIRAAAASRTQVLSGSPEKPQEESAESPVGMRFHPEALIALGASTGGTVAISNILPRFPADMPGTVITQHIPAGFSLSFANRLNSLCAMEVREAKDGDSIRKGLVLIAPGDFHMLIRGKGSAYTVELQQGPPVSYQRPSVDVMFASVAQAAGAHAVGVLLTGMGTDGAKGMQTMRSAGSCTIAQDEASCVVYGMPREAVRLDAVTTVAHLNQIFRQIVAALQVKPLHAGSTHRVAALTSA